MYGSGGRSDRKIQTSFVVLQHCLFLSSPLCLFQLYRLTFWTRFYKQPRVDIDTGKLEQDLEMTDLNLEETKMPDTDNNVVNGAVNDAENTTVNGKLKDVNDVKFSKCISIFGYNRFALVTV